MDSHTNQDQLPQAADGVQAVEQAVAALTVADHTASSNSHEYEYVEPIDTGMMPCGIHKRPHWLSMHPPSSSSEYSRRRYKRKFNVRSSQKHGDCLCDYWEFPALREEREEDTSEIQQLFPFMRLPVELRVVIYEKWFTSDPIEFCPVPFKLRNFPCQSHYPLHYKASEDAREFHTNKLYENTQGFGGLLRANKLISSEALPILYGMNEFRFTNITGWSGLDVFLNQIGMDNTRLLRKITVSHPMFFTPIPRSINMNGFFWRGVLSAACNGMDDSGSFHRKRWYDWQTTSRDAIVALEKAGKLEDLCIVLPEQGGEVADCPFDESKFSDLRVTFASVKLACKVPEAVYSGGGDHVVVTEVPAAPPEKTLEGKCWAQETVMKAKNPKWSWEEVAVNEKGCYQRLGGSQDDPKPVTGAVDEDDEE